MAASLGHRKHLGTQESELEKLITDALSPRLSMSARAPATKQSSVSFRHSPPPTAPSANALRQHSPPAATRWSSIGDRRPAGERQTTPPPLGSRRGTPSVPVGRRPLSARDFSTGPYSGEPPLQTIDRLERTIAAMTNQGVAQVELFKRELYNKETDHAVVREDLVTHRGRVAHLEASHAAQSVAHQKYLDRIAVLEREVLEARGFSAKLVKERSDNPFMIENARLLDEIESEKTLRREAEAAIVTVQQEKQDALAACRRLELEVGRLRVGLSQSAALIAEVLGPEGKGSPATPGSPPMVSERRT